MSEAVTDQDFDTKVLSASGPILVQFWAPWCGPCRAFSPIVDEVAADNQKFSLYKLNIDDNMETASRYGITSIPTLYVFKDGEVAKEIVGALPKPALEAELTSFS